MDRVKLRNTILSLIAGLGASSVHIVLMEVKQRSGILPQFDPYADLQRVLSSFSSHAFETPLSWLLPYINGAMLLGFLFGQSFSYLPGRTALRKGAVFGFLAWLLLGLVLLPFSGSGVFAHRLGLGVMPALLMLVMLLTYAIVVSLIYQRLTAPSNPD